MLDSVTVSMGLLMKGVLMVSLRVRAEVRSWRDVKCREDFVMQR